MEKDNSKFHTLLGKFANKSISERESDTLRLMLEQANDPSSSLDDFALLNDEYDLLRSYKDFEVNQAWNRVENQFETKSRKLNYNRLRLVAAMLAPLLLSVFWTTGFLGLLGIQLNMVNSAVAVFILGLIVDYSIFLTLAINQSDRDQDEHVLRTCAAITISALTTLCGMGALVVARHPALHAIGATALLGLSFGVIAVFTLVPLIVRPRR